jgi:hypothetical protein
MEVISFNTNMQKVAIVDSYKSFIWNDRYEDLGDFELYIPADAVELLANIHQDYYIQCSESNRTMIVEKVEYKTDLEDGNFVIISGHSLESILKRRIIWNDTKKDDDGNYEGDIVTQVNLTKILDPLSDADDAGSDFPVWMAIQYLLRLYVIEPENCGNKPQRKIPNVEFVVPDTDDPIFDIEMSPCSYHGENLYDAIKALCDMYEFSFAMTMDPEEKKMYFHLYKGVSHLASQTANPYVCFSNDFDNLLASDSAIDMSTYKNMAYFKGQGTKYIVKEFDDKEIALETGNVRIRDNKVWAVKIDFGTCDDEHIYPHRSYTDLEQTRHYINALTWAPDEFNENAYYDDNEEKWIYPDKYAQGDLISRTQIDGAITTEDGKFYLSTEPETVPGSDEEYSSILLYSNSYDAETYYFKAKDNHYKNSGDVWDPTRWDRVDIRVSWGKPSSYFQEYVIGTEEEPAKHEEDDVVKVTDTTNSTVTYWTCIEDHESIGPWADRDQTKWIPTITSYTYKDNSSPQKTYTHDLDVTEQIFANTSWEEKSSKPTKHSLFEQCEDWKQTKKYNKGNFITFNDASRTGKITIYRKSEKDATYSNKTKYTEDKVVWYKPKNATGDGFMYVRKKYKSGKVKGKAPSNTTYWTKIKDKYKIFNAQNWEALEDIPTENYDIYGTVQDNVAGGLDRREMFVDASSVPSTYNYFYDNKKQETVDWLVDDGVMQATVRDMALAELTIPANRMTKKFDAEIGYDTNFKYRYDYNIGDIVEVRDAYGYYDSVRVKEFIISHDNTGIKCYPTFESVEASTITTRYLEVNDELLGNTFLVKIPESTRFTEPTVIATAEKDETTYYLMSFVKKITVESDVEKGKKVKRNIHMVAWITKDEEGNYDIWTDYQEQSDTEMLKQHPAVVGEPLFYIDVEVNDNGNPKLVVPGVLFPSWAPPYGTDLGIIKTINVDAGQYRNILLANI